MKQTSKKFRYGDLPNLEIIFFISSIQKQKKVLSPTIFYHTIAPLPFHISIFFILSEFVSSFHHKMPWISCKQHDKCFMASYGERNKHNYLNYKAWQYFGEKNIHCTMSNLNEYPCNLGNLVVTSSNAVPWTLKSCMVQGYLSLWSRFNFEIISASTSITKFLSLRSNLAGPSPYSPNPQNPENSVKKLSMYIRPRQFRPSLKNQRPPLGTRPDHIKVLFFLF